MSADRGRRDAGRGMRLVRVLGLVAPVLLAGCSWFTDFKQQPKIDPWETPADTIPFRGNPQGSVPITGSFAPGFEYDRTPMPQTITTMANIKNPVPGYRLGKTRLSLETGVFSDGRPRLHLDMEYN